MYAACYPITFDPNHKYENYETEGAPEFEPMLKAGGHWNSTLKVPEEIREAAEGPKSRQSLDGHPRSFTWIIEVASQVLFSTSASVHYEVLVGRDERSLDLGLHGIAGSHFGAAGKLEEHQKLGKHKQHQSKGVYSKAVHLILQDTDCLWNTPEFPSWDDKNQTFHQESSRANDSKSIRQDTRQKQRRKKKVHLVVLTHGLHSNIGADMLYLKESIDTSAREAREAARKARAQQREEKRKAEAEEQMMSSSHGSKSTPELLIAPQPVEDDDSEDEEQVIVRGFAGNKVKTERGIQYLGKRMAKYVLSLTYPDQPYLPVKSSISKSITRSLSGPKNLDPGKAPIHKHSSIHRDDDHRPSDLAYQITSISFIAHSLGGLVQTYAIAYIKKHSPDFFDLIKPINFVAMASPFLGLSNENPIYVKFALDFGLVGRTGQDLGLTWRAPAAFRSGWGAVIGGLGKETQKEGQPDPSSKPLLRILPTGPAHSALKKFRNRTVYSNVVNDGIVPLRTSCLLFLDWRGLERVEKARRETGLVGTMASWGIAELTGQNASSPRPKGFWSELFSDNDSDSNTTEPQGQRRDDVPQPSEEATKEDNIKNSEIFNDPSPHQFVGKQHQENEEENSGGESSAQQPLNPLSGILAIFRPDSKPHRPSPKSTKIYQRGQTMMIDQEEQGQADESTSTVTTKASERIRPVRGSSLYGGDSVQDSLQAPPKTTIFESAGDLLNPPLPPKEFILDPAARPRTIFHDRIYHPEDIPAPPMKKRGTTQRSFSLESLKPINNQSKPTHNGSVHGSNTGIDTSKTVNDGVQGSMKVEEKIARAYHHELSWRKVLVRLEPDAHNNMVVRRMFANAYGWPVIKHLCDTHFAYTAAAKTEDQFETNQERAKPNDEEAVGPEGESVAGQNDPPTTPRQRRRNSADDKSPVNSRSLSPEALHRSMSEVRESRDAITDLKSPPASNSYSSSNRTTNPSLSDSARWSDRYFEGSDDDSDFDPELYTRPQPKVSTSLSAAPQIADVISSSPADERSPSLSSEISGGRSQSSQQQKSHGDQELLQHILDQTAFAITGLGIQSNRTDPATTASQEEEDDEQPRLGVDQQVSFAESKKEDPE